MSKNKTGDWQPGAVNLPCEVLGVAVSMGAGPFPGRGPRVVFPEGRLVVGYSSLGWHWMQPVGPVLASFPSMILPDISIFQSWVLMVLWQEMHML